MSALLAATSPPATASLDGAVLTSAQTLTAGQQAQARTNIGAASSASTPAFYATLNSGVSVPAAATQMTGTEMTVILDATTAMSNGRFTPTVEGYYQFTVRLKFANTTRVVGLLYKNGIVSDRILDAGSQFMITGSAIIFLDSNDYVDLYLDSSVSTTTGGSGAEFSFWSATKL